MNLDDFEDAIDSSVILQRGHAYYRDKCVLSLEMTHTNYYEAKVAGSQLYTVTVTLDDDREVEDIACTCPYDWGEYCKHEVAALYSLRHQLNSTPHTLVARPKEVDLASLLEKKSKKELLSFLLSYAKKSPELTSALVAAFPSPDGEVNLTNLGIEFRQACEDGIESPEDDEYGWDDEEYGWQFSPAFRKKIAEFLMMARSAIQEGDIRYGGSIATMMVHELSAIDEYEDEDETLTDEVEGVLSEIAALFDDSTIRPDDGSWLFTQFLPEAKQYKGTLQAVLLSLCLRFAETEGNQKVLRDYLVTLVSDETEAPWGVKSSTLTSLELQHALLIKQGRTEDAQAFALDNLSYEAMRKLAFDYALGAKDYALAEKLAKEKESSAYTPRGGMDWSVLLFNVYQASGNREKVRELAKMFLLHDRLDYYPILKESYEPREWETVVDGLLDDLQTRDGAKHASLNRQNPYPEVLKGEGKHGRLLAYIQKHPRLVQNYQEVLLPHYQKEVFALYKQIILTDGEASSSRKEYKDLASWLRELSAIGGEVVAKECVQALAPRYMKRPAMKDEFRKVGLL
ncbi:MAG TPA: hypothetical protein DCG32_00675 [Sphaerochaeta sp.]|nr:hypothetical protein [Sphaerochaeta sp.]